MSILHTSIKRSVVKEYHEEDTDLLGNICRTSLDSDTGGEVIAGPNMEQEKRIRREIANSNERRRMQSINAGFQSLRTLLPHHEGEKLSKAAILQQTAEYIYNLEQEKTRLLSQNCQLMRQVQQHEGDVPPKKRIKTELIMPSSLLGGAAAESSDEGLGSMSPEPVGLVAVTVAKGAGAGELAELRRQLERERNVRVHLEEQIRTMESQLYQQMQCDSTIVGVVQEVDESDEQQQQQQLEMQLIQAENVPLVGQTETVVCCSPAHVSRSPSPQSRPSSPETPECGVAAAAAAPRLPSVLEAAIKAEPKVEVERLPSPGAVAAASEDVNCSRLYVANTSRQNLETIVEAIRHLEGDHLFGDEPSAPVAQEVPLALTTTAKVVAPPVASIKVEPQQQRPSIKVEMNHFLQFHTQQHHHQQQHQHPHSHSHHQQQQQQSRPGVIVVKQHS